MDVYPDKKAPLLKTHTVLKNHHTESNKRRVYENDTARIKKKEVTGTIKI